ncbi:MAG: choice-of-anchor L domain-containing protein [Ignavibacteria bacterium]|nr:choice-of-anchor L domain-containing protein [Ignavibacteria bacterium]
MKTKFTYFLCLVSIVLFLLFPGCSEENSVTNPPPPGQNDLVVGTLISTPNAVTVNLNDTVLFRFTVNPGVRFTDSISRLIKTDVNNTETEIGLLEDNGNLQNGDEIANDNIYSGRFIINESSAGEIKYKAKGIISSTSNGYSPAVTITVLSELSSNDMKIVFTTQTNAQNQLITFLAGNPNNIENASTQLASWLQTQTGVQSVERAGNTGILINYSSGISGGILYSLANSSGAISTLGGAGITDTLRRNNKAIHPSKQTVGTNDYYSDNTSQSDNILLDPNTIGNRNVLIYEPYLAFYPPLNIGQKVKTRLEQSLCKDFNVTSYTNQEANVAVLSDITKYGMVVFTTHGLLGKVLFTGEIADTNLAVYKNKYKALIKTQKMFIFKNMVISTVGTVTTSADVYVVSFKFISDIAGTFPNSVIVNNSCESSMNPDLANAFLDKGAKTYFGYSKVVHVDFVQDISDSIAKRLGVESKTSGNTFFNASDPETPFAVFEKKVGSNDLNFSPSLINKDFEEGKIEGWTRSGDGRVISRLGIVNPTQGSFMGIISTGLGYTTSSGSISQCFTVQNNQSTVKLKWNFLSEEFLEFINSQYQDYFRIKIIKQDGSEVILLSKTIDQIAAQFGATQQNSGQLIPVSPDIVFDQGGVFMTGWQESTFDITAYRGQVVTIIFSAGDVGDSIYDTAILLDDIIIQ